jgi:hypothetical protein
MAVNLEIRSNVLWSYWIDLPPHRDGALQIRTKGMFSLAVRAFGWRSKSASGLSNWESQVDRCAIPVALSAVLPKRRAGKLIDIVDLMIHQRLMFSSLLLIPMQRLLNEPGTVPGEIECLRLPCVGSSTSPLPMDWKGNGWKPWLIVHSLISPVTAVL